MPSWALNSRIALVISPTNAHVHSTSFCVFVLSTYTRSLQDGLGTINTERVRFQRACEDIELHHQDELQELKQHLAMALTSFQELQRASEHRESEMREALKGATNRSQKFEDEKDALLASMNDQKMNGAAATKEAEMLKEAIAKLQGEHEKKTAEYEDARKRFSQVKEALTVERNLRARAEIKEEQMRQEIIATTGQMHAMRDKFTTDIQDEKEVVDNRTEELDLKVRAFRCAWVLVCVCWFCTVDGLHVSSTCSGMLASVFLYGLMDSTTCRLLRILDASPVYFLQQSHSHSLFLFSATLSLQVKKLSEELEATKAELSEKTTNFTVVQGEVDGLKSALAGASAKASELSSLAEKAGQARMQMTTERLGKI